MHYLPHSLCVIGVAGILFGIWGVKSEQGRRVFDEMAGMIPMGVGALGAVLLVSGVIWMLVRFLTR